jgi:alcohol dehydrogenase class IV
MSHIRVKKLNSFIKKNKFNKILIITGKNSFNFSGFKKMGIYKNFKSIMNIFYKKKKIPEINELKSLIKKINIINPDLIIALGGGCVIDYAKLANALYNIHKLKQKIKTGKLELHSKKTKILSIPTTAGSGAEVTKFSVIYIDKVKYSVEDNLLKSDFYSLVPKLIINSPKIVRASSGFDAIAQAAESIFSKRASISSLRYSSQSLRLSIKNFLGFVNDPNLTNTANMLKAANLSGKAINVAKTNAPHAISYLFTSKFKIPHGIAVSIFFIEIINLYYLVANKKNDHNLIKKFHLFMMLIKQNDISGLNVLFNKFFIESGIKEYLRKSLKNIRYKDNFNFYCNLERLENSPIKILKKDIKKLYSKKFKKNQINLL